jgi:predicted ester cyclase
MPMSPHSPTSCTRTASTTISTGHAAGPGEYEAGGADVESSFSQLRYDIHQVLVDGDAVAIYCTMRGRHTGEFMGVPPTDRLIAFRHIHIVRFEDGKGIEQLSETAKAASWQCPAQGNEEDVGRGSFGREQLLAAG